MGSVILKVRDLYVLWELALQAPTVVWRSRVEMEAYYRRLYGESCISAFQTLTKRLERNGTTDPEGATVEEMIRGNRLGPNAREFTIAEFYELCRSLPLQYVHGDKWDLLLNAAQEVCAAMDSALNGPAWTETNPPPRMLRALRALAVHCGCTNVSWWSPTMGEDGADVRTNATSAAVSG